jgi:hypothetical protein
MQGKTGGHRPPLQQVIARISRAELLISSTCLSIVCFPIDTVCSKDSEATHADHESAVENNVSPLKLLLCHVDYVSMVDDHLVEGPIMTEPALETVVSEPGPGCFFEDASRRKTRITCATLLTTGPDSPSKLASRLTRICAALGSNLISPPKILHRAKSLQPFSNLLPFGSSCI